MSVGSLPRFDSFTLQLLKRRVLVELYLAVLTEAAVDTFMLEESLFPFRRTHHSFRFLTKLPSMRVAKQLLLFKYETQCDEKHFRLSPLMSKIKCEHCRLFDSQHLLCK